MAIEEIKWQMVLLPTDYLQGANRTVRKPPLYLSVRVVKYLADRPDLCVDEQKREGYRKAFPYHPNAKDNSDLIGPPLLVEDGAWCHYPDVMQQELGLYRMGRSHERPMGGGNRSGDDNPLHHGLLHAESEPDDAELAGLFTRCHEQTPLHQAPGRARQLVVRQTHDCCDAEQQGNDRALLDVRFAVSACRAYPWPLWTRAWLHLQELGHLDEHGLAVFLDQAMLPTELTSSQQLQFVHFPKSSMISWGLNGRTHAQQMQSVFWQKKVNRKPIPNERNWNVADWLFTFENAARAL